MKSQIAKPLNLISLQVTLPNSPFDSDSDYVTEVVSGDSVLLDTYLKDDILQSIVLDVTDNSGSAGASNISAMEVVFEYCGYQGEHGIIYFFC